MKALLLIAIVLVTTNSAQAGGICMDSELVKATEDFNPQISDEDILYFQVGVLSSIEAKKLSSENLERIAKMKVGDARKELAAIHNACHIQVLESVR